MIHSDAHDPILGSEWSEGCSECLAARNATFAAFRRIVGGLGPYDTEQFVARMQEAARGWLQLVRLDVPVAVSSRPKVYDWAEMGDL